MSKDGTSPEGEEGEQYSHVRNVHFILTLEHAAPSERTLHEFEYNPVPVGFNTFLVREGGYNSPAIRTAHSGRVCPLRLSGVCGVDAGAGKSW